MIFIIIKIIITLFFNLDNAMSEDDDSVDNNEPENRHDPRTIAVSFEK